MVKTSHDRSHPASSEYFAKANGSKYLPQSKHLRATRVVEDLLNRCSRSQSNKIRRHAAAREMPQMSSFIRTTAFNRHHHVAVIGSEAWAATKATDYLVV